MSRDYKWECHVDSTRVTSRARSRMSASMNCITSLTSRFTRLRLLSSRRMFSTVIRVAGTEYNRDETTNVTPTIINKVGRNLHLVPHHPLNIIKERIVNHFHKQYTNRRGNAIFAHFDNLTPVVTVEQNFDSLLVPKDHVARSSKDNYYINSRHVLRSHTSAHQRDHIKMGLDNFLITGDVYRRDEIDRSHYPAFHQMEGVKLFTPEQLFQNANGDLEIFAADEEDREKQAMYTFDATKMVELDLKCTLENLVKDIFGQDTETRWLDCYFPFTHPSFELEIKFDGEWMEMLGSGVMRHGILKQGGAGNKIGWAFGLGLDRLAMLMFGIPDIRLLWSTDNRFIDQFKHMGLDPKSNVQFVPFSIFPPCFKDISFWLRDGYSQNDFFEVVRSIGGDMIEKVDLIDEFVHPTNNKQSHCYRITFRSMDRVLLSLEVNEIHNNIRKAVQNQLCLEVR